MNSYQVQYAKKPNLESLHHDITHLGGVSSLGKKWDDPIEIVIRSIANGDIFYLVHHGQKMILKVMEDNSLVPYLMAFSNGVLNDHLLELNDCEVT